MFPEWLKDVSTQGTRKENDILFVFYFKLIINMCKFVSRHDPQGIIEDISNLHIKNG